MSLAIEPKRILLVEDDEDTAELLAESLAERGHEVRVASDGETALTLAASFRPEAAVLDFGLPDMDGCELARALRRGGAEDALLIALTGYSRDEDRRRAREAGFDLHLVKPVLPLALCEAIEAPSSAARLSRRPADAGSRPGNGIV